MNNKNTDLNCTIVILSYNVKNVTDICISKALAAKKYAESILENEITITVVDNGSPDNTAAMIRKKYKNVELVALKENVGASAGYNAGLRVAQSPFILIINSDTYLEEDTVLKSLQYMKSHKKTDVLMVRLVDEHQEFRPYGGHLPTPARTIS